MSFIKRGDTYGLSVVDQSEDMPKCQKCNSILYVQATEAKTYCTSCGQEHDNPNAVVPKKEDLN
jgi:hypothetical protein